MIVPRAGAPKPLRWATSWIVEPATTPVTAVVLSTGKTLALTKITRARDAVLSGDYVAPRR